MNRAVAISITMLCVAAALPPGVVRAQSTVTIDPSPPSASVAPGDTGAFPATEATESTPGRSAVAEQLLWTAGALQSLLAEGDYATTLLLAAANRAAAEAPDGFVGDGVRSLAAAMESGPTRQRLQQCRAARDEIENALCSIETLAAAAPNGVGRLLTDAGARLVGDAFRAGPTRGLPVGFVSQQLGGTYASAEPLQRFAEPVLEEALRLALSGGDSGFRELVGTVVGIDPGASLESLVSAPAIANLLGVNPTLARLSEGEAALRDVVAHYQGVVDSSAQSLAGILGALTGAGGEDPENILTQALDLRLEWAADRSLSYLASRAAALMGEDDGTVARVRAIGSAIADLKLGAASFAEQLASFGQQAAAASLAGNVLSVAMGVTSFFGLTPGALGPASARDVRALRAAVDTIRAELHGRFDTVDASLDTLMLAVGTGFERLESLVASGNADVQAHLTVLTRELSTLGQRLDRMETNLLTYMQDGFSREYNRTLVRCLEHRERLLPPYDEMEFQVFSDCLAEFRTRAVRDARDALLTDQTTPVDDASLASTLASGDDSLDSLGRQLSLLGRAAQERFGYAGMRGGRGVANPVEWAIAAQAYLTLLHDWPQHAGAVTTGDLEAILAVGKEISDVLSAIARNPAGSGTTPLLAALDMYRSSAAELAGVADVLARRHQQAELLRVSPDSVLQWVYPADPTAAVAQGNALRLPDHLAALVPEEVRTAAVIGLGQPTLTYRIESQDTSVRQNFRHRFLFFGKRHDRLTFTRSTIEIELRFGPNGPIARFTATGPNVLRRTETINGGDASEDIKAVAEHIPDVPAHFVDHVWPALAGDPTAWTATTPDAWTLATIGGRIEAELRRYATAALNDVFAAVCGIGASRQLQPADASSAERMRSALETMTAARGLIHAYLRLGLPESLATNSRLRDALFGPQAILDRTALCDAVRAGDSPLRLVWFGDNVSRRATLLADALDEILSRDDSTPETLPLVEQTMKQLEAAIRLQRLRVRVAQAGI